MSIGFGISAGLPEKTGRDSDPRDVRKQEAKSLAAKEELSQKIIPTLKIGDGIHYKPPYGPSKMGVVVSISPLAVDSGDDIDIVTGTFSPNHDALRVGMQVVTTANHNGVISSINGKIVTIDAELFGEKYIVKVPAMEVSAV